MIIFKLLFRKFYNKRNRVKFILQNEDKINHACFRGVVFALITSIISLGIFTYPYNFIGCILSIALICVLGVINTISIHTARNLEKQYKVEDEIHKWKQEHERFEKEWQDFLKKYRAKQNLKNIQVDNQLIMNLRILGINNSNYTVDDIKKNYRQLMKKYHPDISKDNGEMAKVINSAYDYVMHNLTAVNY